MKRFHDYLCHQLKGGGMEIIMKIIYTFPDNFLYYECSECNGLCCNLNAILIFKNEQIEKIDNIQYLREYMIYGNEKTKLVCGKKCWFLKRNKCSLSNNTKPLGCKMYPINVWKLDNKNIIADIIPCPNISISSSHGMRYCDNESYIYEYVNEYTIKNGRFQEKIKLSNNFDIEKKLVLYETWKTEFFKKSGLENNTDNVIKILFAQIPVSPVVFYLEKIDYDELYNLYWTLYLEMKRSDFSDNIYNLFIALRNATIKNVLYRYYFPYNKTIYNRMNETDRDFYKDLYENRCECMIIKEKVFDMFYFQKESIWRLHK